MINTTEITIRSYLNGQVSEQEVADYAVTKIREQGCASFGDLGYCAFRGKDGAKCIIGHLLPDDEYETSMDLDGLTARGLLDNYYYSSGNYSKTKFIAHLQSIHDGAYLDSKVDNDFLSVFNKKARFFYNEFNLTWLGD